MTTDTRSRVRAGRRRTARRTVAAGTLLVMALLAAAPAATASGPAGAVASITADRQDESRRGALLDITPVAALDRAQVAAFVSGPGIDARGVRYGVTAHRLTYRTVTPTGAPTTATGLLVLPRGGPHRLSLVSDTHGTMVHRDYAPSVGEGFGRLSPYLYAAGGRAVAAPDYLGLGRGPGRHPYMDTRSSVSASLDMLRAARQAARRLGRPLTGDVYATGFSQGGQVAMGLGRELAGGADRGFRLRALAPISGPYDIEGSETPGAFDGRVEPRSAVFYFSYFLTAQNRLRPLYRDPAEVFRAPYAGFVEDLFDGSHGEEEITERLPGTPEELFTADFLEELRHPSGELLRTFRANDGTCDWRPDVPVRLYTASGDRDVPIANSRACAADLARHGRKATVVDQGAVSHFGAFGTSAPRIAEWFDAMDARATRGGGGGAR
ncbi:alpha/beta hydrolase [Streptomyces sp. NBC_00250]|uniref:alpha/beta hydrolase n=1 Tax=Streptomyces sp. NBC_00250 TaxID=2903641 RepID=UPI002E29C102|nr:alpha/beta hydrolase [Streptomyces sp. NBC_00250]